MGFKQLAICVCALAAVVVGCDDDDGGHQMNDEGCALEQRDDEYVAGLQKIGENGLKIALLEATPSPPAKDDNTWRIQVLGDDDAPLAGMTVTATPFMPDHGHGTPINAGVTELSVTGEYEATPVNLWMPGLWETTIEVSDGTDITDSVTFSFCIDG